MTTPRDLRPVGSLVKSKWRIASVLRSGTAAALYLATNRSGNAVALKIVHHHLANDERIRQRLFEEAEIGSLLDHPGVVRVLDEDAAEDGAALLLLEPLDGETLEARRLRLGGALPLEDVFDTCELLLDVLRVAHGKGQLHFELTPQNLFLTDTGLLKVLDFGALDGRPRSMLERGRLPIVWPAAFTAPELLLDEPSDVRSDIWSVGALLYAIVTGSTARPTDAEAASVASVPARSLKESALELPRAFVNIVDRALEFDRADRWPDVEALQQALRWARRSVEGGWGGSGTSAQESRDSVLPRPSRSALAEQARLARQRSAPPPKHTSASPSTGPTPTPVDGAVPAMARWREDALLKNEQDTRSVDPAAVTPQRTELEESTLVGVAAPKAMDEKPDASIRMQPRRASEPTLQSASIVSESERKPAAKRVDAMMNVSEYKSEHESDEPDTLIRTAPTPRPNGPLAPGALDQMSELEPETQKRARIAAKESRVETAATDTPPPPAPIEPQPPTVRIPSRAPPALPAPPLRRVLTMAGAIGVVAGALGFVLWPRTKPVEPITAANDDAGLVVAATETAAAAALLVPLATEAGLVDAAVNANANTGAALDASIEDASLAIVEEDAAALVEAKLAAERKRRRERALLEAERAKQEAGTSAAGMSAAGMSAAGTSAERSQAVAPAPTPASEADAAPRAPKRAEREDDGG